MVRLLLAILLLGIAYQVDARSTGAPLATCDDMTPSHGVNSPQEGDGPFFIRTNIPPTYVAGSTYQVYLQSSSTTTFKGFFCQARSAALALGGGLEGTAPVGAFTTVTGTKHVTCEGSAHGAITHSQQLGSGAGVQSYAFDWTAPSISPIDIVMRCSFVVQYDTFYVQVSTSNYSAPASTDAPDVATMTSAPTTSPTVAQTTTSAPNTSATVAQTTTSAPTTSATVAQTTTSAPTTSATVAQTVGIDSTTSVPVPSAAPSSSVAPTLASKAIAAVTTLLAAMYWIAV